MEVTDKSFYNRWENWTKVILVQETPLFVVNWDWCNANCRGRFDANNGILRGSQMWIFEDTEDALMFKMARVLK